MSNLKLNLSSKRLINLISDLYWYHTIELTENMITRGAFNHKEVLNQYGFPKSLEGMNVLDVGAADGFFSFEFERRGAKSVLAIDTNKYDGSVAIDPSISKVKNYNVKYSRYQKLCEKYSDVLNLLNITGLNQLIIAKDLKESNVDFRNFSIYNLDKLNQKFNLVFCGDLMIHLKNPLTAIEQLVKVTKNLCIISLSLSLYNVKTPPKIVNKILQIFQLSGEYIESSKIVKYIGNESGGAFFNWHPLAFKEALLASGFKIVNIYSNFKIKNYRLGKYTPHTIFHCYT